jgi:aryl-alcohol dehydrogenase-like predicted oxidoreductase
MNPGLLDLVQLPLSLLDQRLLQDGTLARLRALGTAVHARSLYLQGLLLTPAEKWPPWVPPEVRTQGRLYCTYQRRGVASWPI